MTGRRSGRRALAWLIRVVVVVGLVAVAVLDPFSDGSTEPDAARILRYDAQMQLGVEGDLRVEETLVVRLPPGKRGIFRIFDTADPRRPEVEHPVEVLEVTRDGSPEPFVDVDSPTGTRSVRIGDAANVIGPGDFVYRIVSRTTDVLEPGDDEDETLWWWDVVGSGWQLPMDDVSIDVALPAEPLRVECVQGEDTPCDATTDGATLSVRTGPLEPFTPVTVRTAFDAAEVAEPISAPSPVTTIVLSVLAGLVALVLGVAALRATREREPGFPVLFEPPVGVPPALGVRVLDETDSDDDLQATLFDLAQRGVLEIVGDGSEWLVRVVAEPSTQELHPVERTLLSRLGLFGVGSSFTVSKSTASGKRISEARTALRSQVTAASRRYLSSSTAGVISAIFGWIAAAGFAAMVGLYLFADGAFRSWPLLAGTGVFVLVVAGLMVDRGSLTIRTAAGRDVWSRTGGFARFLTTDSSEARFDAAAHLDWYPRYLPWAVALGSADEWAKRYEAQGVSTPEVPWFVWTGVGRANFNASSMNRSFNAAIASAAGAYAASQSSSGGGGFSGGSGGGGGGGGSW